MKYWVLKGKIPLPTEDVREWAKFFEESESRRVRDESIGEVRISTVFLGLDHSWGGGPPLIFETMIFGGELDQYQTRCSTWEQAETMHEEAKKRVLEVIEYEKYFMVQQMGGKDKSICGEKDREGEEKEDLPDGDVEKGESEPL